MELSTEVIFQLTGHLLLLGYSVSETNTKKGLEGFLKNKDSFGIDGQTLLIVSALMSTTTFIKYFAYTYQQFQIYQPIKTKIFLKLYAFIGLSVRVLTIVMYFAPYLGLFDLLRHLQAEQIPWNKIFINYEHNENAILEYGKYFNENATFDYGGIKIPKSKLIRLQSKMKVMKYFFFCINGLLFRL